jgi:predicted ATPase/class 3 adenylate cyclase
MLFSDIEGSTALLRRLGERYAEALSGQRGLLREAFNLGDGRELGTEGDSFFVVFESAGSAVRSCIAAQRALASHSWPADVPVRVRLGLHSGEPARYEDGYVGMDVHRAARIAAAAHGGQVVLSEATRQLAEAQLDPGVLMRDLGWHRLKDIEAPEHLYQLVADGLDPWFPPLKSLGAKTSLPVAATPLIGREDELRELVTVLSRPVTRLVTLTGTGGVGKTRMALAAASSVEHLFPYGVFFVPLATVSSAGVMWKTIAEELDVGDDRSAVSAVTGFLRTGPSLLVLDNLEQLEEAPAVAAELLTTVPDLVVLATSRRPLHVLGEQEWPVPPLGLPAATDVTGSEAETAGAIQLFVQQATLVSPAFALTAYNAADVAEICRRLDGLPLAIELVAARVKLLAPKAILARFGQSLGFTPGDALRPLRQQTLRNTIAWSYNLLGGELRGVFQRMGVFEGGCDVDAFAAVALTRSEHQADPDPLEWLGELVDVSLLTVAEAADGEPRVLMLETVRRYAMERLDQEGDPDAVRRRHADYYAEFAGRACSQLHGRAQWAWLDRLEIEQPNLRAAMSWSLDGRGGDATAVGLRLVQNLAPFWYQHGHAREGRRWLELALEAASRQLDAPDAHAQVAHWLGVLLEQQGETTAAIPLFERSLAVWRDVGDQGHVAIELNSLGIAYRGIAELDIARSYFEDSIAIAREIGADDRLATALGNLGIVEIDAGNLDRAVTVLRDALVLEEGLGRSWSVAIVQTSLVAASLLTGHAGEAQHCSSPSSMTS